jgi:hypothetical protein
MVDFWYASYIFLGLSLSIGLMILLIVKQKKARKRRERDINRAIRGPTEKDEKSPLKRLEDEYEKKG